MNNQYHKILPVSLMLILFSIHLSWKESAYNLYENDSYFEGRIFYQIDYLSLNPEYSTNQLKKYLGTKMTMTFKDGNFKKEFYNLEGQLIHQRILNRMENKMYLLYPDRDTVLYYNPTESDYDLRIIQAKKDTIIGRFECKKITLYHTLKNKNSEISGNYYDISYDYFIALELKNNPRWFNEIKDGGLNELYNIVPGIEIQYSVTNKNFVTHYSFLSHEAAEINDAEFFINNEKPLKRI